MNARSRREIKGIVSPDGVRQEAEEGPRRTVRVMPLRTLFLSTLLILLSTAVGYAQDTSCSITITSNVDDALVFVDHTLVGKVPLHAEVVPGPHEVRVSAGEDLVPFEVTVTAEIGTDVPVHALLEKTAVALFRDGVEALRAQRDADACALLEAAAKASGKRPSSLPFYLGLLAERRHDARHAEACYLAWVTIDPRSASGQYRLGLAREALGKTALATTAYKNALRALLVGASDRLSESLPATQAMLDRLAQAARPSDPASTTAAIQAAYQHELRGALSAARDRYRKLFETLVARYRIALDDPSPPGLPLTLTPPRTRERSR